jgi:hypothetical protein
VIRLAICDQRSIDTCFVAHRLVASLGSSLARGTRARKVIHGA